MAILNMMSDSSEQEVSARSLVGDSSVSASSLCSSPNASTRNLNLLDTKTFDALARNLDVKDALAIEEALSSTQTQQQIQMELKNQVYFERLTMNRKMVKKYQTQFQKIPTMTSQELVARWRQQDREEDERDASSSGSDSQDSYVHYSQHKHSQNHHQNNNAASSSRQKPLVGPTLLLDVRSKKERSVSIIPGAVAMDDLETTRWMNKYVHNFDLDEHEGKVGIPTIVCYCTIGYRSGREAQRLVDDLTSTFGIEIGKQVQIYNLDGILSYSFVQDAPPLMSHAYSGGSDYVMTRRIHSYGKEWSEAINPDYESVYFDSKPKLLKALLKTGSVSALRFVQHQISKSTAKVKETTVGKKTCVEPVAIPSVLRASGSMHSSANDLTDLAAGDHHHPYDCINDSHRTTGTTNSTTNRISLSGYTTNANSSSAAESR